MSANIVQKINQLMASGDFAAARKRLVPLARKEPDNPGLQNMTGLAFARGGQHRAALPWFAAAVRAAPQGLDFRCNLATSLILSGEHDKAISQVEKLLAMAPGDPRPWHYKAMLLRSEEDFRGAEAAADKALSIAPRMADALNLRAVCRNELQKDDEALADFEAAAALQPGDVRILKGLAKQMSQLGRQQEALDVYDRILSIDPGEPGALSRVAATAASDQLPRVIAACEAALAKKPKDPEARAHLTYALALATDRSGDKAAAMAHFTRTHEIDARHKKWDPRPTETRFEWIRARFPPDPAIARPAAIDPAPIFIVGLPRSGTTLAEMILSMAEGVVARGELPMAENQSKRMEQEDATIDAAFLERFAQEFRETMPEVPPGSVAFTDKMPDNFQFIGPLAEAFPNARFICIRRDPRDVALSMWKRRFPTGGLGYTSRLEDIAEHANLFRRCMAHWSAAYGDRILTIRYEELVADMETGTRAMAAHCGLGWNARMLHPEESEARVATASVDQVRGKVHTGSVGRWHLFGDAISRLTDNLDPDLWPEIFKDG